MPLISPLRPYPGLKASEVRPNTDVDATLPVVRVLDISGDADIAMNAQQVKDCWESELGVHVEVCLRGGEKSLSVFRRLTDLFWLLWVAADGIPAIVLQRKTVQGGSGVDRFRTQLARLLGFNLWFYPEDEDWACTSLDDLLVLASRCSVPRAFAGRVKLASLLPHFVWGNMRRSRKAVIAARSSLSRNALRQGVAPATEHQHVLSDLQAGSLLDVGANCGQFAISARVANSKTKVVSFEPLARPAKLFEKVFDGSDDIDLRTTALGSQTGTQQIHVSLSDDSSSLLRIGSLQVEEFPGTDLAEIQEVAVSTLDKELFGMDLPGPVLLKLDVQGFELEVLRGGGDTLARTDFVYCEVSFLEFYEGQPLAVDVMKFLSDAGFTLMRIGQVTRARRGQVLQADLLFGRR